MAICLTITDTRTDQPPMTRIFDVEPVVIGRGIGCDVCLPDLAVSARHAEIRLTDRTYGVVDLGSLNSTRVDGKKTVAYRPKALVNGSIISIAHFELEFTLGAARSVFAQKEETLSQARRMLERIIQNPTQSFTPHLVVTGGPSKAARFPLPEGEDLIVGRSRQVAIHLDDPDVSRHHAKLQLDNGILLVTDLESRNGLTVGGQRVNQARLEPGEGFTVGGTTLTLEHPIDPALMKISRAPEEETTSYEPSANPLMHARQTGERRNQVETAPNDDATGESTPHLATGPIDPLQAAQTSDYVRTVEMPTPRDEEKSDLGLIVVGGILVIGCVLGLLWLLT